MSVVSTKTYGRTLAECKAFVSKFRNTCPDTAAYNSYNSVSEVPSSTHSCSNVGKCIDTGIDGSCTWYRRLCVKCYELSNEVYINVLSNGLPDHCFSSPRDTARSQNIAFSVKFNTDPGTAINHQATT